MKMSDYNSTTAALQSEHLDKWHTFNQVVPKTRTNAGWTSKKVYRENTALAITFAGQASLTANNNLNSASRLTLTGNANGVTAVAGFISGGDILVLTSGGVSFNATVYSVTEGTAGTPPVVTFEEPSRDAAAAWGTAAVTFTLAANVLTVPRYRSVNNSQSSTVWTYVPTIDTINIKAHGIDLYQTYPSQFYATYLPYIFGGPNVNTPQDKGCHFVNFAMYPGTYQPSGHVNVSRAREFYFTYKSSVVGANAVAAPSVVNQPAASTNSNSGYLYLLAAAINFLLISDGGAVLRYST